MLWFKGWLETRVRLLILLGIAGFLLVSFHSMGTKSPPTDPNAIAGLALASMGLVLMMYTLLAGAGIVTQPSFQATKGLHGSTLFTLALPVSRLRLLAVRASLGWLELTGAIAAYCWGLWLALPLLRGAVTAVEMTEYTAVLVACASSLYFLSVLLATFLDDVWRTWGSMLAFGALWWLSTKMPLPASLNVFRAMGEGSPLLAHTMPWTAMVFSVGMAVVLFVAAWKVAQVREY